MKTSGKMRSVAALSSIALLSCLACGKISYNFSKLEVDSNLKAKTSGVMFSDPTQGDYYFMFHEGGLPSIHHFQKKDAPTAAHRLLFLELDNNNIVQRTVKHEVLLGGPYGIVYADKHCFYKPLGQGERNTVSVGTYANPLEEDIPAVLKTAPADLPPLTQISYVRVFHIDPEYVVVSANYEANGDLGSLHVDHTRGGQFVSGESHLVPKNPTGQSLYAAGMDYDILDKYGIPSHIDVAQYLKAKKLEPMEVKLAEERMVLNLHYGWDKYIRQDELRNGDITDTHYFQPTVTKEEETLNPLCDTRMAQEQAAGMPTVR